MARFKVVKGGTLLVGVALVILVAVVVIIALSWYTGRDAATSASTGTGAVMALAPDEDALTLDPATVPAENEHTDEVVSIQSEVMRDETPVSNGKRVLIYHTHTHEAYEMDYPDEYVALEKWRTDDDEHNIVRVGTELTALLEARGFEVVHDTTDNEQDDLSTAYERSLVTLNAYSGEKFDLYIDMHRDAYTDGQVQTCSYGGESAAKLMVLIGSGENFNVKPFYKENYAFALSLTDAVNAVCPGLCRDVMVKTGRYNQHIGVDAILVEVGNNMNTLEQALASMPALADAIEKVLVPEGAEEIITVSSEN